MRPSTAGLFLLGAGSQTWATPPPVSKAQGGRSAPSYAANKERADAVKQTFQISWNGYYRHAFPHDSLLPVTNGFEDDRNGWGASAVDAFSTALVMENWDVIGQILEFVPTINFNVSSKDSEVSLFETTIRYLGGLLSAYDLLTGPLADNQKNRDTVDVKKVLQQAVVLADNLKVGFDTPSGVPDNTLYFNPPRIAKSATNGIATIGTLILEWQRLSDLTGNPAYGQLAAKGESYLLDPKPALGEPFPGLLGSSVNITDGLFVSGSGSWGGGTDSFYEYLIKMFLYDPTRFGQYKERWVLAADSTMKYLTSHPSTRPDLTFVAAWRNTTLRYISQHLACFHGGSFILGGLTLDESKYTDYGLKLVESCHETYVQTATGIGPEIFSWQDASQPVDNKTNPPPPPEQADFYKKAGFWINSGAYVLRPEVLESIYYAYRATGDKKYQEWAWDMYLAINATTSVGSGFSSIDNVNAPAGGGFTNFQESFWFAEVLKYAYLIHAEDAPWQVKADHTNEFVYNTECHPIRIAKGSEQPATGYDRLRSGS